MAADGVKEHHILITLPIEEPTSIIEGLRKRHSSIASLKFIDTSKQKDVPDETFQPITILITLSTLPSSAAAAPSLSLIHFISAGTNHIATHPIYTSSSIPLTTSSGIHGPQIAEWVILTSLASSHSFPILHDWQRAHDWNPPGPQNTRLKSLRDYSGQRLGVLGYGSIGRQAARVAKAMGMDVVAFTARPRTTPESKHDTGYIVPGTGDPDGSIPSAWYSGLEPDKKSLHEFLSLDIDQLLISLPLTNQTRSLLGPAEFSILGRKGGRHPLVQNISRGQILDQSALIHALETYSSNDPLGGPEGTGCGTRDGGDGGIRGAALDVTDPEPLPREHPLWDAPNCIVTPHISGQGAAYNERALDVFEVNYGRLEKGEGVKGLINLVNRERGY